MVLYSSYFAFEVPLGLTVVLLYLLLSREGPSMPVKCCAVEHIKSFAVLFSHGIRPSTGGMNAYGKTTEGQSPGPMIGRWACDTTHRGRCRRHCCVSVRNAAQRIPISLALKALPDEEHCLHLFVFFFEGLYIYLNNGHDDTPPSHHVQGAGHFRHILHRPPQRSHSSKV